MRRAAVNANARKVHHRIAPHGRVSASQPIGVAQVAGQCLPSTRARRR